MKHAWLIELSVILTGAVLSFMSIKMALIMMVFVGVVGMSLLMGAMKNPMVILRHKNPLAWKKNVLGNLFAHVTWVSLVLTLRCLLHTLTTTGSMNFILLFLGYYSFLSMLMMVALVFKHGFYLMPVIVAPGLLDDISFPLAGIPIVDCLLETGGWNNGSMLLLSMMTYSMIFVLLYDRFMHGKWRTLRLRDLFLFGSMLSVLLLRYGDYAPTFVNGQGYVDACCHMSVTMINRVEGGLAYVLPYVLLVFYAVDDVRNMRNNKTMILTRLSGYKEYVNMESKILLRDVLVSSMTFNSVLMVGLERSMSLNTLEVCLRNVIIVGLFSEIFLVLLKWIKEQEAIVSTMAMMFVMCFSGMLAIYRQRAIACYNLFTFDVIYSEYTGGSWVILFVYLGMMIVLEIFRRMVK